ncbi:hypothetical protein JQ628_02680 [Bradyrhizobium lablabi]|uniref:hypothetical protein n=1 Tax=Bradyrhizobium lablabi TaxID=722472 RepID=UPI001BA746CC|nr:hypothetical protein [Bradyrhizobium lablabi]MBR1120407.1 hypothetical protein [Bradyrhizobium lablabi]
MKLLKIICGIGLLAILASNIWSISRWHESRGVYDDVCYLRQAHLFQRFGWRGIDTDITRDDDRYFANKLKEIGYPEWDNPARSPCHTPMPALNKIVIQYPPGTGFMLAAFPAGFQVIPLFMLASLVAFGFAVLALLRASTFPQVVLAAIFGDVAVYLMINPTKASYSMAPTMMVCALAGYLTARFFVTEAVRQRIFLSALIGLLIGLSVSFRLPNVVLASGYGVFFLGAFLIARNRETFLDGLGFSVAFLIGLAPTLAAHAINAGSPFATTYGGIDIAPPELNATVLLSYVADLQFVLLVIAAAWSTLILRFGYRGRAGPAALLVAVNLALNIFFFMTHPVFTPYYTVPVSMLSLWTLLFATLKPYGETAAGKPRPATTG